MNTHDKDRSTLKILAVYSTAFSFLLSPVLLGERELFDALMQGAILSLPSLCYWLLARELLLRDWSHWLIHFLFLTVVVPISLLWMLGVTAWAFSRMII